MTEAYCGLSDERLTALAQDGDRTAEEALLNRYKGMVRSRSHLYFIVGADAEDVIQEGMIGLFKAVHSYREERDAAFKTFAALCVNRQILTAIKAASRRKHGPLNDSISLSRSPDGEEEGNPVENILAGAESNPEELILMQDRMDRLLERIPQILSRLEQRVWNAYLEGKDYRTIADETGKSTKAVDNALQRIRHKIAKEL